MESFGIKFRTDREDLFPPLVRVFDALKRAKAMDEFAELEAWDALLAEEARAKFYWPTRDECTEWSALLASRPVAITQPSEALGQLWDFGSLLDAIQNGEYTLLEIARTSETTAELRIDPEAYPDGGIGAFVALVEAHGMHVLGVDEYGKYQSRSEFAPAKQEPAKKKSWWRWGS